MAQTSAERQRHRGEPQGNAAMMAQMAALQTRVAQVEVEISTMPSAGTRAPSGWLLEAFVALRQERDELAVQLAQAEKT